jgi:H+/gluconate symporter-like permease
MKWTRNDVAALAVAWIALVGFVVLVCVLLPTPPPIPAAPQLTSVMLDFFFGAVAIALAVCLVSVALTVWFVRRASREAERRLDERFARAVEKGGAQGSGHREQG